MQKVWRGKWQTIRVSDETYNGLLELREELASAYMRGETDAIKIDERTGMPGLGEVVGRLVEFHKSYRQRRKASRVKARTRTKTAR